MKITNESKDDDTSSSKDDTDDSRPIITEDYDQLVTKDDIAEMFKPISIDPLKLTDQRVKKTRDSFQENINILNNNMIIIDGNLRQLLNMTQSFS